MTAPLVAALLGLPHSAEPDGQWAMRPAASPQRSRGNSPGQFRAECSSGKCPAYRYSLYSRRRRTHPPPALHRPEGSRNPGAFRRVSAESFGGKSHRALSPGAWLSLMTTALASVAFPGPPHHVAFPVSGQPDVGCPPPFTAPPWTPLSEQLLLWHSLVPRRHPRLVRRLAKSRLPVPTWELAPVPARPEPWLRGPPEWGPDPAQAPERARRGQHP